MDHKDTTIKIARPNVPDEDERPGQGEVDSHGRKLGEERGTRTSLIVGWLGILVIALGVFGVLPWGIIELRKHGEQTHVQAWFASGVFVLLAVPMTVYEVAQHLSNWYNPLLQRYIVRILWMVPIYAINSWFSLRFIQASVYLDTLRECYEAYVIFNFFQYLLHFLRQRPDFDLSLTKRENHPHMFPFCCMKPWRMGQDFLNQCAIGVTSYVVVRILTTLIALICELAEVYGDGEVNGKRSWVYLATLTSLSQLWAMYCLVLFYQAFKKDLSAINPLGKFLTIKAVVFFSFWQSVLIAILVKADVIKANESWSHYTQKSVAVGLQDFLICVEMFIAALAHHYVFSYKEHLPVGDNEAARLTFAQSIRHIFDVTDVSATVFDHVQTVATTTIGFRSRAEFSEKASLLSNDHSAAVANEHLGTTPPKESIAAAKYGTS